MSWAQLASVQSATNLLTVFLGKHHQGAALDRPVQDFLAGAIADAADDAASQADVVDLASMVAEMIAEYLFPAVKGHIIEDEVAAMIQAVQTAAGMPSQHRVMHEQEYVDSTVHAVEALSLRPAAEAFVPRAAAVPFVPPTSSVTAPTSSDGAGLEAAAAAESEGWDGQQDNFCYDSEYGASGGEPHEVPCIGSDEAIELLAMQFPQYSVDYLEQLLACNGGDVVLSMEVLSQYEACLPPAGNEGQASEEEAVPEARPPVIDDETSFPTLGGAGSGTVAAGGWGRTDGFADALRKRPEVNPHTEPYQAAASARSAQQPPQGRSVRSGWQGTPSRGAAPVQWVETGVAVERMYADARAEARDQARIRNAYFEQATQAYLAGNRALAKDLGAKGRAAGEEMKAAHAAASKQIYSSRNHQEGMVDLHGLHTTEAISILGSELKRLKEQGHRQAHVLVGTGHHTRTRHSTLPVAVEGFLKERAIPFRVAQAGLLEVRLL